MLMSPGMEGSDLSTHSRCEWKNSHRIVGLLPKFLELYMDFWCRENLPFANLGSFTTGIETNPGWIPFICQEKAMLNPWWGISCAPALDKLPSHSQSTPMNQRDGAGPSLIFLRMCLRLALIDSELSFHSPEREK